LMADGLGHGPLAARAADEAVRVFRESGHLRPAEILEAAHGTLRATRGASVAIAEITYVDKIVRYAGIGNIAGAVLSATGRRSLVSSNGTLGHELHQLREFSYSWPEDGLLILHSDGLHSRWQLETYPGLIGRHVSLIAGVLYRDFVRGSDDVTVLAARVVESGKSGDS
jgi:serine phosphatase RsbU (regulator of sigma subunit)